jgi:TM2 domain-containing membrane protein YozV
MRMNFKAALLSGLVLPGVGQIYNGHKIRGGCLILLVNLFLLGTLFVFLQGLGPIIAEAELTGTFEPAPILGKLQQRAPTAKWLLLAFCLIWLYSTIDALLDQHPRHPDES